MRGSKKPLESRWQTYLEEFPGNHEPAVSRDYSDLTAMFRPAKYVPSEAQRNDTLREFLLSEAPDSTGSWRAPGPMAGVRMTLFLIFDLPVRPGWLIILYCTKNLPPRRSLLRLLLCLR